MEIQNHHPCLQINAPELAKHKRFCAWLNKGSGPGTNGPRTATWHRPENKKPGEFSDVFVWKDLGKEGSDTDMPEDVWAKLCKLAGENFAGIIWITFLK